MVTRYFALFFKDKSDIFGHQCWMIVWDKRGQRDSDSAPLSRQIAIRALFDAGVSLKSAVYLGKMLRMRSPG